MGLGGDYPAPSYTHGPREARVQRVRKAWRSGCASSVNIAREWATRVRLSSLFRAAALDARPRTTGCCLMTCVTCPDVMHASCSTRATTCARTPRAHHHLSEPRTDSAL